MSKDAKNVPALRFKGYSDAWEKRKYGDIAKSFQYGLNAPAKKFDGINKYLRITDIDDLTRLFKQESLTSPDTNLSNASTYLLKQGDVLFARTGASTGKTYKYRKGDGKVYFAGFLIRADLKPKFDSEFFYQTTLTDSFLDFVKVTSQRSGQPGINSKEYANKAIQVPELSEQQRIGSVLAIYDNLIAATQDKIDAFEQIKKAFLQHLFDQSWRFGEYSELWTSHLLGEITSKVTEKNTENLYHETFTNSAKYGIVEQQSFFDKLISNEANLTNYYVVRENDFVYNPRISNLAPVGPVRRNKLNRTGVMSPLYYVFKATNAAYPMFLEYFFKGESWYRFMYLNGDTGARSDRFAIKDKVFEQMPVKLPEESEQKKIGALLQNLETVMNQTQERLQKIRTIKDSLLKSLFV
ncbi:restriction endonuclease subunit S [Lacticaseibacillus paracasei]|jgi:type I restriction enzyme S subunit|uniref:restriction endonuclease subunit S n=1 Tax=Lacticaseibacillus paracasei TaxID=1597 RepID=UPI0028769EC9|nr:restriction endonuclease subunit S [Lacticaseibacillus paracasei]MDS0815955.1 restriction endonuclease subunit S [Lacticaseibacillus paracasei]